MTIISGGRDHPAAGGASHTLSPCPVLHSSGKPHSMTHHARGRPLCNSKHILA